MKTETVEGERLCSRKSCDKQRLRSASSPQKNAPTRRETQFKRFCQICSKKPARTLKYFQQAINKKTFSIVRKPIETEQPNSLL